MDNLSTVDVWLLIFGLAFVVIGMIPFVAPAYFTRASERFWAPKEMSMPKEIAWHYEKYGRALSMVVLGAGLIAHIFLTR